MLGSVIDAGRYVLSIDDEAEDGDLLKSQASIYLFRYFLSTYPWRFDQDEQFPVCCDLIVAKHGRKERVLAIAIELFLDDATIYRVLCEPIQCTVRG